MANAITCGAPLHLPSGVNWDGLIPYRQWRTKTCGFPLTVPSGLFGPAGVFEQNVAFTVAAMRKEEENRVVRWAVVRGFHERTAAPSSEPRRQSRVQVVSLRAASMYL